MNEHLTEQQLIDYQFKLASEEAMARAAANVDSCDECRRKLQGLAQKFASLDLLREEIVASEALRARTVAAATKARRLRMPPLPHSPWLGAMAAALLIGVALLVVATLNPGGRPAHELGRQEETPAPVPADATALTPAQDRAGDKAKGEPMRRVDRSVAEPIMLATSTLRPEPAAIEKPPFAPASAIELVVLPRREDVQLTIYNGADLTLVRERRNLTLKRGWNWLQFMWANTLIDPTSLRLEPLEHGDRVEVRQLVFPPRLRQLGRWLIRSEVTGQVSFELTYFTSGLSWRAFYMGTFSPDETTMDLQSYVRVDNGSGEDYENVQTRLLVGQVHLLDNIADLARRQYAHGRPVPVLDLGRSAGMAGGGPRRLKERRDLYFGDRSSGLKGGSKPKEVHKEGLSEYFLYTIEGTETIPNEWGTRLLSFEADGIPVQSLYKYDEQRWGDRAIRFLSFANDEEHRLGETPIPDGAVRVYSRADEQGHLAYVGAMDVKYIPVGEEVELNLGPARLVKVEPTLMEVETENYVFDANDNVAGWDQVRTWKIEVTNARSLPVEIEVTRGFDTPYWELTLSGNGVSYEKHDTTHARFKRNVEPRSKEVFTYTVTTYHGVREEVFIRRQREQQ